MNVFTTDHPISSEPTGGMPTSTIVCGAIAFLLFVGSGFFWHRTKDPERMSQTVLEEPIYFENGFAVNSSFTVALAEQYQIEVACQRTSPNKIILPLSHKLPVTFLVTCDEDPNPRVFLAESLGGSGSSIEDTRTLATFIAEPNKHYELSFHVIGEMPSLAAAKSVVRICLPRYSLEKIRFTWGIYEFLFRSSAGVGAVFALLAGIFLVRRLIGSRTQQASQ